MNREELVKTLNRIKDEMGWTLHHIHKVSGVGLNSVHALFNGKNVSFQSLLAITKAMGLKLEII